MSGKIKLNLRKLLNKDNVFLDLKAETKEGVIRELVDRLVDSQLIKDKEAALGALFEREKKMSTGMEFGIALPHGKTDSVKELVPALAIKKEGVDFQCFDGQPAKIFVMTLSPKSTSGPHIQFLAEVSNLLNSQEMRDKILAAETAEDIRSLF